MRMPTKTIRHEPDTPVTVEAEHAEVKPNVAVLLAPDDLVREHVGGFVDFLREHAIVGLAVGFVVGTQVQSVVKQLISSFIDPLSKLFIGNQLSAQTVAVHWHGNTADFGWGAFVYVLIDFLLVVGVIYALIKIFKLDKLDKPKVK